MRFGCLSRFVMSAWSTLVGGRSRPASALMRYDELEDQDSWLVSDEMTHLPHIRTETGFRGTSTRPCMLRLHFQSLDARQDDYRQEGSHPHLTSQSHRASGAQGPPHPHVMSFESVGNGCSLQLHEPRLRLPIYGAICVITGLLWTVIVVWLVRDLYLRRTRKSSGLLSTGDVEAKGSIGRDENEPLVNGAAEDEEGFKATNL